jgi:hypothetical protein
LEGDSTVDRSSGLREREVGGAAAGAGSARIRDGAPFCVAVFLSARVFLSVLGVIGVHHVAPVSNLAGAPGVGDEQPSEPGWHNAVDGTDRWDAGWFTAIAKDGYVEGDGEAAFFPGFPLLVRAVMPLTGGNSLAAALLVSNTAFLAALLVLFALTTAEYGVAVARRTIVLTAFFPTAFFFLAPYSESLFLFCALAAFWFARRGTLTAAGIGAAAAASTRAIGVVLLPSLVAEAFRGHRAEGRPLAPGIVAALATLVGPALYLAWWGARGDLSAPIDAQAAWGRELTFPLVTLGDGLALAVRGLDSAVGRYWSADALIGAAALVPFALRWRSIRSPYLIYGASAVLVPLCYALPARPLLSLPRFVVVVFPVFWALALLLHDRRAFAAAIAFGCVGYALLAVAFMNWGFVF